MILRSRRAASRASRSTSAPRPVFTMMAVGFIIASSLRPRKLRVSVERRTCRLTTSASVRISSLLARRAPLFRVRPSSPSALQPSTVMPVPRPMVAGRPPIAPLPKTPSVLPTHWVLLRPALGEDADRPEALGALVTLAAVEDGGEVVRDDDHAGGLEKTAWAAETPAPASLR